MGYFAVWAGVGVQACRPGAHGREAGWVEDRGLRWKEWRFQRVPEMKLKIGHGLGPGQ